MRNHEIIEAIYKRCPDMAKYPKELSIDQIFDRTQDIIDLIERERPTIAAKIKEAETKYKAEK